MKGRWSLRNILLGLVSTAVLLHGASLGLSYTFFAGWTRHHFPLHSTMETVGAVIAIGTGLLLLMLEKRQTGTNFNVPIAAALFAMGAFDGLHAAVRPGTVFVWLHTLSTVTGGTLSATVWIGRPATLSSRFAWGSLLAAVVVGVGSILFPSIAPPMAHNGTFTVTAYTLNIIGGVLFGLASLRLGLFYQNTGRGHEALFAVHFLFFGVAALTFGYSGLWNFAWWGWHGLRLLAYGAALVFAIDSLRADQRALRTRSEELEQKVDERTEKLQAALDEKETLLKEIHHRVKNNMQIIASMLSLQASDRNDEKLDADYESSLRRIRSMALVHELLYQSESMAKLNFTDYIERLIDRLQGTVSDGPEVQVDGEDIQLSTDRAIRCGLVLNELVTNCFQHAFKEQDDPRIIVRFHSTDEGYRLQVQDNGRGLADEPLERSSIGMDLIQTLVETDLQGAINIDGSNGTTVTIHFPEA